MLSVLFPRGIMYTVLFLFVVLNRTQAVHNSRSLLSADKMIAFIFHGGACPWAYFFIFSRYLVFVEALSKGVSSEMLLPLRPSLFSLRALHPLQCRPRPFSTLKEPCFDCHVGPTALPSSFVVSSLPIDFPDFHKTSALRRHCLHIAHVLILGLLLSASV